MLGLPHGVKIYFCSQPVDFRKGFDGLSGLVESEFEMNVLDGHLFLFVNRRGDRIKALWWEPGGSLSLPSSASPLPDRSAASVAGTSDWSKARSRCLGPTKANRMSRSTPRS